MNLKIYNEIFTFNKKNTLIDKIYLKFFEKI